MRMASLSLVFLLLLVPGCVMFTGMPMTPEAFREAVRGGAMFTEVKHFEAQRSYGRVSRTLAKKAHECFNVVVETTSSTHMSYSRYKNTYTPTVVAGADQAELYLQQKTEGAISAREPEAGHYMMVVDVFKRGRGSVAVDMYVPTIGHDHVVDAVEQWIRGTGTMCPDLN